MSIKFLNVCLSLFLILVLSNPLGLAANASDKESVEVAIFTGSGGMGLEPWLEIAKDYEELNPEVKVNLWGNPRIEDQLRPRIIQGDTPDVIFPRDLDLFELIYQDKIVALDDVLKEKAYGTDKSWEEVFAPGMLELGRVDGKQYLIVGRSNNWGWIYNKEMFEKHGWEPPRTWGGLMTLCKKIKSVGIDPIALGGAIPWYVRRSFTELIVASGGLEALEKAGNLEPGAWNNDIILGAAQKFMDLQKNGYIQDGAMGMNHTISQSEFVFGNTAMCMIADHVEMEMANITPEGFRMGYFPTPGDEGPTEAVGTVNLFWAVLKDGKNINRGKDFIKYVFSPPNASKMFRQWKYLLPLDLPLNELGATDFIIDVYKTVAEIGKTYSLDLIFKWYPSLDEEVSNALTAMLLGEISPKEAVDRMEREAERIRASGKNLYKYN